MVSKTIVGAACLFFLLALVTESQGAYSDVKNSRKAKEAAMLALKKLRGNANADAQEGATDGVKKPGSNASESAADVVKKPGSNASEGSADIIRKPGANTSKGTANGVKKPRSNATEDAADGIRLAGANASEGADDGVKISSAKNAQQVAIFDVRMYGARGDGKSDDSQAIASAWREACTSAIPSTVRISKGNYMIGSVIFKGPCKSPVTFQIEGNLKAPADLQRLRSQDGWVVFQNIDGFTVSGGGAFDGQGSIAWATTDCRKTGKCRPRPVNLLLSSVSNSKIQGITSLNSKQFHMNILNCKNLTLQQITIHAPANSLNTDGIHIGRSTGINIIGADIRTGDDCVSLGDGSQQINIEKVTCGPGHGISVGSLGKYYDELPVTGVTVRNCTLTNTMNGVRVKTWPGSPSGVASDLSFEDIIMNNVRNPILIDQNYCPYGHCQAQFPSRVRISNVSFKNIRGTSATQLAVRLACSRGMPCQNVHISDINLTYNGKGGAVSECSNVKPIVSGKLLPPACVKIASI